MAELDRHKIGWIGVGRMGYPMVERLAKAGADVTVYNRTRAKAEPLMAAGMAWCDTPRQVAESARSPSAW